MIIILPPLFFIVLEQNKFVYFFNALASLILFILPIFDYLCTILLKVVDYG